MGILLAFSMRPTIDSLHGRPHSTLPSRQVGMFVQEDRIMQTTSLEGEHDRRHVTRGAGRLEYWLAQQRAQMADQLIDQGHRSGRILDIGCGRFPYFLAHVNMAERIGIDRGVGEAAPGRADIKLYDLDVTQTKALPFDDTSFDVVSMLAVIEQ